jgi:putative Mg2+ transporter-C (MgtC) family protein
MTEIVGSSEMFGQILLAAALGMIVGAEREHRHKAAGLRTYSLVAIGAALFTILSVQGMEIFDGNFNYDPGRIASQVVMGIGFIGAGLIIFKKNRIRGLTGAAGVWATAAIGMTVGMGLYYLAIFATVTVLLILFVLDLLKRALND